MLMPWLWGPALGLSVLVVSVLAHYAWQHGVHPRPHFAVAQYWRAHLGFAVLVGLAGSFMAGAFTATTVFVLLQGPAGIVEPPVVAQHPQGVRGGRVRALGLVQMPGRVGRPHTFSAFPVPAAVDLTSFIPPVAYQGAVASCASWAVGYYARGYYLRRSGHYPRGGLAPMFLYASLTHGANTGTTFAANLALLARGGIDSAVHYHQGAFNFADPPTAAERRAALRWKSRGFHTLFVGDHQGAYAEQAIKQALAGGDPVLLGIPVYQNFLDSGPASYYIARPIGPYYGAHAVLAVKYDANGVVVVNEWGTNWGLGGYVQMSWPFITAYALEASVLTVSSS